MRRAGGNFEIDITAPSLGLVTRVPAEQPDKRSASAAQNVRFEDGVVRNGPGYGVLDITVPDAPGADATMFVFQGQILVSDPAVPPNPPLIATSQKIYALTRRGFVL